MSKLKLYRMSVGVLVASALALMAWRVAWATPEQVATTTVLTNGPISLGEIKVHFIDDPAHKLIGYYAYADRRRYFSTSKHGGWSGAKSAAEAWPRERKLGAS